MVALALDSVSATRVTHDSDSVVVNVRLLVEFLLCHMLEMPFLAAEAVRGSYQALCARAGACSRVSAVLQTCYAGRLHILDTARVKTRLVNAVGNHYT